MRLMNQPTLFPLPEPGPSRATKLRAFMKEHGILTHCAREVNCGDRGESRWLAILAPSEKETGVHIPSDWGVADYMARYSRLLEESGRTGYGPGEYSAVKDLCAKSKITFTL
jgi:hypothetical protein